jgi:deoxyhypusine synthase
MVDDADLLDQQIDRYYDVYVDELEYRKMEGFVGEFMRSLQEPGPYSSADLLNRFGRYQTERGMNSITAAAYRAGVPVFSPALADSGLGVATYLLHKNGGLHIAIDQLRDFVQLGQIGERAKSTSVIYIGGGVPKDTVQLVTVMASLAGGGNEAKPHKYAVQVTTDSPQWGGLSGCTFEEAISWGKIAEDEEDRAVCYCDATIALPILSHALTEVLPGPRKGPDLSWLFA